MILSPAQNQSNKKASLLGMSAFIKRSPDQSPENLDMILTKLPYPNIYLPNKKKKSKSNLQLNVPDRNDNLSSLEIGTFINQFNSDSQSNIEIIQNENQKSHHKKPPIADANLYPEDITINLSKAFMELFVLIYQIRTKHQQEIIFSARRVYACIFSKQLDGATFEDIQKECPEPFSFEVLKILLEFGYIVSVNSC